MIIDKFLGIHNTSSRRDIPGNSLQDAIDVDITNAGAVLARTGYVQSEAIAIESAYTTRSGDTYIVSGGNLYRINSDLTKVNLGATSAVSFCDYDGYLFTNDGKQIFRDAVVDLTFPHIPPPNVTVTGGGKAAGRYNIVTTLTNASGLESGASSVTTVTLASAGDFLITPYVPAGHTANTYVTDVDGTSYFNLYTGRRIDPYLFNENPFPQHVYLLEYHETQLYCAVQFGEHTLVYYSEPNMFHLFGADDPYFIVPGTILGMASTPNGMVIATDQNIYSYQDGVLSPPIAAYGAVPGRPMLKLPSGQVLIHTPRGVCSALPLVEMTQNAVSLAMGTQCNTVLMFENGIERYLALHNGQGDRFNAAF